MRQLDLFRVVHGSRKSDRAARSLGPLGSGHTSWMGLVLACEPARTLQSRVVRRGRNTLGSLAKTSLVEREHSKMGGQRWAGLQSRLHAQHSPAPIHHKSSTPVPHL